MNLIDADAQIAPLKEEYKKLKQAFDETSVFQAPNDVALYGTLMQEVGAVIEMIEGAPTVDAVPISFIEKRIEQLKNYADYEFEENGGYAGGSQYRQWELECLLDAWAKRKEE